MRRVAMLLSIVGLMALGLAAIPAPAEAHDGRWGYSNWRHHDWRGYQWRHHHRWYPRYHRYGYYAPRAYYYTPGVTFGFTFR